MVNLITKILGYFEKDNRIDFSHYKGNADPWMDFLSECRIWTPKNKIVVDILNLEKGDSVCWSLSHRPRQYKKQKGNFGVTIIFYFRRGKIESRTYNALEIKDMEHLKLEYKKFKTEISNKTGKRNDT